MNKLSTKRIHVGKSTVGVPADSPTEGLANSCNQQPALVTVMRCSYPLAVKSPHTALKPFQLGSQPWRIRDKLSLSNCWPRNDSSPLRLGVISYTVTKTISLSIMLDNNTTIVHLLKNRATVCLFVLSKNKIPF